LGGKADIEPSGPYRAISGNSDFRAIPAKKVESANLAISARAAPSIPVISDACKSHVVRNCYGRDISKLVQFRVPDSLSDAIEGAANKHLQSKSEYLQQSVIEWLEADGASSHGKRLRTALRDG
jgi:hypothetical protein